MSQFEEKLNYYKNADYDELVCIAKDACVRIIPFLKKIYKNESDAAVVLFTFVISAVGADSKLTSREKAFVKDVIKAGDELITKCVNAFDPQMNTLADSLFDSFPKEIKEDIFTFVLCTFASDGEVNRKETDFARVLLA